MSDNEKEISSVCPHCGYPLEINEHSPECPNNPSNKGEEGEQLSENQVNESELRLFTRENLAEERGRLAEELTELRRHYYEQKRTVEDKLSEINLLLQEKTEEIDELEKKQVELEQAVSDKSKTLFSRIWHRSTIRAMDSEVKGIESGKEARQADIKELLRTQEEVAQTLSDKQLIEEAHRRVEEFYKSHIDDFRQHQEEQRLAELERFEKDEQARQVERISRDFNGIFLHGIMHKHAPGTNSLLQKGTSFETKLKLAVGLEPTISTSVIQKGDSPRAIWARMGVVISEGRVDSASPRDAATVAQSLSRRSVGMSSETIEEIEASVRGTGSSYNEFVVSSPKIAGMYYSPDHEGTSLSISEDEFFRLAKELELPTYVVQKGELFEVSLDEESGEHVIGDIANPERLKEKAKDFSQEEKEKILSEALETDMPFRVESILPEARFVASRSNGMELYMQLKQNELNTENLGEEVSIESLGLDPEATKGKLVGEKVKLLQEVKYPGGETIRYFENNGVVYQQEWNYEKNEYAGYFHKPEDLRRYSNEYIKISRNTWKLENPIRNPDNYLKGMTKSVRQELEKYNQVPEEDTENREYYRELLNRLAFHLRGFAETAERYGDNETSEEALKISELIMTDNEYKEIIDRRLDKKEHFKITREDLE